MPVSIAASFKTLIRTSEDSNLSYFFKIRKVSSGTTILFDGENAKQVGQEFLESTKKDVQFEHSGLVIYDDFSDWEYTDSNCMSFGSDEPWMKAKPDFRIQV